MSRALWTAVALSLLAYGAAFVLAFSIDQPFGPILVFVLAGFAVLGYPLQSLRRAPAG